MTKSVISHEENVSPQELSVIKAIGALLENHKTRDIILCESRMLDAKVQPFFEDWKVSQNELKNARVNPPKNIEENTPLPASFFASCRISDIIENNEFVLPEVPSYYLDEAYVKMCDEYHIPYKKVYHSYRELDATEELVADYVDLLKTAKNLCIHWDTSIYDPEGLAEAIEEAHSEESDHNYFAGLNSDRWDYYSRLGV